MAGERVAAAPMPAAGAGGEPPSWAHLADGLAEELAQVLGRACERTGAPGAVLLRRLDAPGWRLIPLAGPDPR